MDADFHGHHPAVKINQRPLWCLLSLHLDSVSQRSVHPASPILLTRMWPTRNFFALFQIFFIKVKNLYPTDLEFVNKSREKLPQCFYTEALPDGAIYIKKCFSYSKENFGKNQLLGHSIGLSPLYPAVSSDLHVSTDCGFHLFFKRLHQHQVKFVAFRVASNKLYFIIKILKDFLISENEIIILLIFS